MLDHVFRRPSVRDRIRANRPGGLTSLFLLVRPLDILTFMRLASVIRTDRGERRRAAATRNVSGTAANRVGDRS